MKKYGHFKRRYEKAKTGSRELGPLGLLPGKWEGKGTGWNMIALPFDGALFKYRILKVLQTTLNNPPRMKYELVYGTWFSDLPCCLGKRLA